MERWTDQVSIMSHSSSAQQWPKPSSHTPVCFPDKAVLLGYWPDCLDSAHPTETELKLRWRRRRTWGSIGSAGCLSICCRQHTLQNSTGQSPAAHPTVRPPQHTDSRLRGNLVLNVTSASLPCDTSGRLREIFLKHSIHSLPHFGS